MPKVFLKGYMIIPDAELDLIESQLNKHIELTQQEAGCVLFEILQNKVDLNKFEVYEVFTDQQSFEAHQLRVQQSEWGRVTANIEIYYQVSNHHHNSKANKLLI